MAKKPGQKNLFSLLVCRINTILTERAHDETIVLFLNKSLKPLNLFLCAFMCVKVPVHLEHWLCNQVIY